MNEIGELGLAHCGTKRPQGPHKGWPSLRRRPRYGGPAKRTGAFRVRFPLSTPLEGSLADEVVNIFIRPYVERPTGAVAHRKVRMCRGGARLGARITLAPMPLD